MTWRGQKALQLEERLYDLLVRALEIAHRYQDQNKRPGLDYLENLEKLIDGQEPFKEQVLKELQADEYSPEEILAIAEWQVRQKPVVDELLTILEAWVLIPPDPPLN